MPQARRPEVVESSQDCAIYRLYKSPSYWLYKSPPLRKTNRVGSSADWGLLVNHRKPCPPPARQASVRTVTPNERNRPPIPDEHLQTSPMHSVCASVAGS